MTKKIPASSSGISTIDGLMEELRPFLWLDSFQPVPDENLLAVAVRGRVRVADEVIGGLLASPSPNRDARRALLDRVEEIVTMLGDRLAQHPEITIKGERNLFEDEEGKPMARWQTFADVRLVIEYD